MAKLAARNLQALIAVPARLAADVLQLTRQADSQYYTMLCDNAQMQVLPPHITDRRTPGCPRGRSPPPGTVPGALPALEFRLFGTLRHHNDEEE